jgi:hypothetical protein
MLRKNSQWSSCSSLLLLLAVFFQVTIVAVEQSLLLTWSLDKLRHFLESNPSVSAIFNLLIGKDISDKLYQIQEMLLSNPDSPLRRTLNSSPVRLQGCDPSPHSSIMNLRSTVVSGSSTSSLDHIHCFGIDFKGNLSQLYFGYWYGRTLGRPKMIPIRFNEFCMNFW